MLLQWISLVYDAVGKILNDGVNQYLYDGDGRLCAVHDGFIGANTQYLYDAEGHRIAKGSITTFSCDTNSNGFTLTERYVVGQSGEQVSELDGSGNWSHSNVYAEGELLATYDPSGLHFQLADPLGTRRVQVLADLSAYENYYSLPFGNYLDSSGPPSGKGDDGDATEHHFTGKEHDYESGNDYFGARYYNSAMGRWLTPDPSGLSYADPSDPQSLNLYSYVRNNPLVFVDPTGLALQLDCYTDPSTDNTEVAMNASDTKLIKVTVTGKTNPGKQHCTVWDDGKGNYQGYISKVNPIKFNVPVRILNNDPCYNKQLAAVGVGPAQLRQRIATANSHALVGALFGPVGALFAYAQLVHTGGPQDDKNLPQNKSVLNGPWSNEVQAGNISFGVTCPFGAAFCQFAAGAAQTLTGNPDFNGTLATGFDTPSDNAQIRIGQAMRAAGCHN